MNKTELIAALITRRPYMSEDDARAAIDAITDIIGDELAADRAVTITGFGTFGTVYYSERVIHNPRGGEPIDVPSGRRATFHPGDVLRRQVQAETRLYPIHR